MILKKLGRSLVTFSMVLASLPAIAADYTTREFDNGAVWYRFETPIPVAFHMPAEGQYEYADYILLLPDAKARDDVGAIRDSLAEAQQICKAAVTSCEKAFNTTFVGVLDSIEIDNTGTIQADDQLVSGVLTVSHLSSFNPTGRAETMHTVMFSDAARREKMRLFSQAENAAAFKEKLSKQQ